jgi:hypothetical protein
MRCTRQKAHGVYGRYLRPHAVVISTTSSAAIVVTGSDTMSLRDEPDFEVTDLRTGLPDERAFTHEREDGRRRRVMGVAVTALVLLAMVAIPFFQVPGFRATLRDVLHVPTAAPAPPIVDGSDIIYFEHGLPWGTLLVDGKLVTNVDEEQPYTGFEQLYTSLRVAKGRHLLSYGATPFPVIRCWLSVPAARGDTCPLISTRGPQDVTPPFPAERVLDLGGAPENLPESLRATLESAATQAVMRLSTTTSLSAGEPFAGVTGAPQRATSPLAATLSYAVTRDPAAVYVFPGSARSCAILCATLAASYVNSSQGQWTIAAHVVPHWAYRRADGTTFEGSASPLGMSSASVVPLEVRWNGGWQVHLATSIASSPMCFIALNLISAEHLAGESLSPLRMVPATNPADGCLITGDGINATGVSIVPFTVMYRFGLLFAVDEEARRLLPTIHAADPHLQALAQSWAG